MPNDRTYNRRNRIYAIKPRHRGRYERRQIMNNVILIGRLTRDPETRQTTDGTKVANYTLAVDRVKKGETDFIKVTAWGRDADFAEKYLTQGTKIAVKGRIQTGSYQKQNGETVYTTVVVTERQEFVERKKDDFVEVPDVDDIFR